MVKDIAPLFRWIDTYQLGIEEFDAHHQKLVQLLNSSYYAFVADSHPQSLVRILDELSEYTVYHFSAEERWMLNHGYPGLTEHIKQHEAFKVKLAELQHARQNLNITLNNELFSFLADWLATHILESDAAYGSYRIENSIR